MNSIKKILSIALFLLALVPACKGMDLDLTHRPDVTLINAALADSQSLLGRPYFMGRPGTITKVEPCVVSVEEDIVENIRRTTNTVAMEVTTQGKYLDTVCNIQLNHYITKRRHVNAEDPPAIGYELEGYNVKSRRHRCTKLGIVTSAACAIATAGVVCLAHQLRVHGLL